MTVELLERRIVELFSSECGETLEDRACYLVHDLGAELPRRRLRDLRQYQLSIHESLRERFAPIRGQWDGNLALREGFLCGVLYGTYHLCAGYAAQLAPELEERALTLKVIQADLMRHLATAGAMTPSELARATGHHVSSISRALRALRDAGLARTSQGQGPVSDHRQKPQELTHEGLRLAREFLARELAAPAPPHGGRGVPQAEPVGEVAPEPLATSAWPAPAPIRAAAGPHRSPAARTALTFSNRSAGRTATPDRTGLPRAKPPEEATHLGRHMQRERERNRRYQGGSGPGPAHTKHKPLAAKY